MANDRLTVPPLVKPDIRISRIRLSQAVLQFAVSCFHGAYVGKEENGRLKWLVADQAVQIHILKEVNAKQWQARLQKDGQ